MVLAVLAVLVVMVEVAAGVMGHWWNSSVQRPWEEGYAERRVVRRDRAVGMVHFKRETRS
jgi:hypothetical protein